MYDSEYPYYEETYAAQTEAVSVPPGGYDPEQIKSEIKTIQPDEIGMAELNEDGLCLKSDRGRAYAEPRYSLKPNTWMPTHAEIYNQKLTKLLGKPDHLRIMKSSLIHVNLNYYYLLDTRTGRILPGSGLLWKPRAES